MSEILCDCCGKRPIHGVYASGCGPVSFGMCLRCIYRGRDVLREAKIRLQRESGLRRTWRERLQQYARSHPLPTQDQSTTEIWDEPTEEEVAEVLEILNADHVKEQQAELKQRLLLKYGRNRN